VNVIVRRTVWGIAEITLRAVNVLPFFVLTKTVEGSVWVIEVTGLLRRIDPFGNDSASLVEKS